MVGPETSKQHLALFFVEEFGLGGPVNEPKVAKAGHKHGTDSFNDEDPIKVQYIRLRNCAESSPSPAFVILDATHIRNCVSKQSTKSTCSSARHIPPRKPPRQLFALVVHGYQQDGTRRQTSFKDTKQESTSKKTSVCSDDSLTDAHET